MSLHSFSKRLDVLDVALIYDVPPWLITREYPRCWRNRVLWQVLRGLHRARSWVYRRRSDEWWQQRRGRR